MRYPVRKITHSFEHMWLRLLFFQLIYHFLFFSHLYMEPHLRQLTWEWCQCFCMMEGLDNSCKWNFHVELLINEWYHFMSLLLNLVNTFLKMVDTYIIVLIADDYSLSLGVATTVCGVMIGSMAFSQIFSLAYFSA